MDSYLAAGWRVSIDVCNEGSLSNDAALYQKRAAKRKNAAEAAFSYNENRKD
jgi:hypothetical protein